MSAKATRSTHVVPSTYLYWMWVAVTRISMRDDDAAAAALAAAAAALAAASSS
jgi:hypothetical protein